MGTLGNIVAGFLPPYLHKTDLVVVDTGKELGFQGNMALVEIDVVLATRWVRVVEERGSGYNYQDCKSLKTKVVVECQSEMGNIECENKTWRLCTHAKLTQLIARRQQIVFTLLVPSCEQFSNKLLTACNKTNGSTRLIIKLP